MIVRLLAGPAVFLFLASAAAAQEAVPAAAETANSGAVTAAVDAVAPATPGPRDARSATAAIEPRAMDTSKDYRIGPEDVLDVLVWKNAELSRTVPVRPDGKVSLPLVNDIQAAGLTPAELRQQLTQRLSEYVQAPEVSVIVKEVHSFKVSVQGAVRMPNQYEIKSDATVLDMLSRAQGFTEFADKNGIVVLRRTGVDTTRIEFNYKKAIDGRDQANFLVQPGDVIIVP